MGMGYCDGLGGGGARPEPLVKGWVAKGSKDSRIWESAEGMAGGLGGRDGAYIYGLAPEGRDAVLGWHRLRTSGQLAEQEPSHVTGLPAIIRCIVGVKKTRSLANPPSDHQASRQPCKGANEWATPSQHI